LNIRKLVKVLLLIFVVLSFVVLIYKEFSPRSESNATDATTKVDTVAVSGESVPVAESQTARETSTRQKDESPPKTAVTSQKAKVIAYYFHGNFRCTTCRTIEQYSHDAIQEFFTKELGNGRLEFRPVNVEEGENHHYIQNYQLFSKALVLVLYKDDKQIKWENLKEVWIHVRDKEKFFQYVKDEVEKFLKEAE